MSNGSQDAIEDFDKSPRPAKRQRLKKAAVAKGKGKRKEPIANPSKRTTLPADLGKVEDSSEDGDAFESAPRSVPKAIRNQASDSDDDPLPKKPKHRIHQSAHEDSMAEIFVTQAPDLPSSPGHIRGPIWLKQAPAPPVATKIQLPLNKSTDSVARAPMPKPTTTVQTAPQHTGQRNLQKPAQITDSRAPSDSLLSRASSSVTRNPAVVNKRTSEPAVVPRRSESSIPTMQAPIDISTELADLPSDAFSSSSPEKSPERAIYVSSQAQNSIRPPQNLRAPQSSLRQTTLLGGLAQNQPKVDATKTKKHAWPMATQQEPPTHHRLNQDALSTWVYPTNLGTIRDYQYNIVSTGLFHNLLVALPTGLGKTFIAATVMLNWFRWTTDSQIVFLAPTKPLVAQQVDACFNVCGIPRSETVMLTGGISPGLRAEEWLTKRVFFMTPQTMINDLKTGICDPKKIVLIVVDEAHRATGAYSYVEVVKFIRRFSSSFRVLALTATPGSKVETVQQVIDGLDISRVEIRTEQSMDIRQYVHTRETETCMFDYSMEQEMIMELFSKAIKPVLDKLNGQNAYWMKDPMKLTAFGLTQAQRQWNVSEAGRKAPGAIKGMVFGIFTVLASLAHTITMLKFHGIAPFFRGVSNFRNNVDGGQMKGKYGAQIRQDENFNKMMNRIQAWINNPDFIGHPKLEHLRGVILNHFMDAGEGRHGDQPPSATRVMVFAQYRDSAEEIARVLKRNEPMIRPHVFVGQADAKGSEGMDQKKQLEVIKQFKDGIYNTLVATSIGEEGLDIGEVDLIICYDANASPIRMLQRMGRTGRKRKGNIVILLMHDKEERDWLAAKDNYEKMQVMIASGKHFTFHEDKSPRILPKEARPVVDKRVVEIPPENSQPDLPEPKAKGRRAPKRPAKKFFMPDGVRTGFVQASRMDGSDDDSETAETRPKAKGKRTSAAASTRKMKRQPTPEPESAQLPYLEDVLLNKVQERELARKYQYVSANEENAVVTAPRPEKHPEAFRHLSATKYVGHGNAARITATMMERLHAMDSNAVDRFKRHGPWSNDDEDAVGLLVDTTTTNQCDEQSESEAPPPPAARGRKANRTPTARARKGRRSSTTAAMEAASSSPEPTPADMRLPTQGIDLGSGDTSGEDGLEEGLDSELADFVVASDQPIEYLSSSLPQILTDAGKKRFYLSQESRASNATEDDLPEIGTVVSAKSSGVKAGKLLAARKRRKVVDDDSDD